MGWKDFANARPNAGHYAIAALEMKGIVTSVITQNVDRYESVDDLKVRVIVTIHFNAESRRPHGNENKHTRTHLSRQHTQLALRL